MLVEAVMVVDGGDDVQALIPRLNQLQRAVASLPRHTNHKAVPSSSKTLTLCNNKFSQIPPCRHGGKNISLL